MSKANVEQAVQFIKQFTGFVVGPNPIRDKHGLLVFRVHLDYLRAMYKATVELHGKAHNFVSDDKLIKKATWPLPGRRSLVLTSIRFKGGSLQCEVQLIDSQAEVKTPRKPSLLLTTMFGIGDVYKGFTITDIHRSNHCVRLWGVNGDVDAKVLKALKKNYKEPLKNSAIIIPGRNFATISIPN